MRKRISLRFISKSNVLGAAAVCLMATGAARSARLLAPEEPHKVKVVILARNSSVTVSGTSQDKYLVEVFPKQGRPFLGQLIDSYPYYESGLPEQFIGSDADLSVALLREPSCDTAAKDMFFSGGLHLSDILAERAHDATHHQLGFGETGHSTRVPCFTAVHKSWKHIVASKPDMWWR